MHIYGFRLIFVKVYFVCFYKLITKFFPRLKITKDFEVQNQLRMSLWHVWYMISLGSILTFLGKKVKIFCSS